MMSWDFPYRLGGPVLAWEVHRGNQLWTVRILTICFLSFCLLHFFVTASVYFDQLDNRIAQPSVKKYEKCASKTRHRLRILPLDTLVDSFHCRC